MKYESILFFCRFEPIFSSTSNMLHRRGVLGFWGLYTKLIKIRKKKNSIIDFYFINVSSGNLFLESTKDKLRDIPLEDFQVGFLSNLK